MRKIWKQLNETTWINDNHWAGEGYTFFETNDGIKRCATQIYGSGVYVTSPLAYFIIEFKNDTIRLLCKNDKNENIVIENLKLEGVNLKTTDGKYTFRLFSKTPLIFDIQEPASGKKIPIDEIKKNSLITKTGFQIF